MNNNFIPAEEFLKQSEKVQEVLIKWWKPQMGDLYCDDKVCVKCILSENTIEWINTDKEYKSYVPLLQMHQLINFIEDKVNKEILINTWEYKGGIAAVVTLERLDIHVKSYKGILDALWQVTIQIIEGE